MSTKTISTTKISPLMMQLEASRNISKQERRAALKLKLKNSRNNKHILFKDSSGNDALMLAEKRALIREHITRTALMKQMGVENIPTFSEVWNNYLERINNKSESEECCATSSCGCGSSH